MTHEVGEGASTQWRLNVLVPVGRDRLAVASGVEMRRTGSAEAALRDLGRQTLNVFLSPQFAWAEDGLMTFVTDPVGVGGYEQAALARLLYEQRWVPHVSTNQEEHEIVFELCRHAVKVVPLTADVIR